MRIGLGLWIAATVFGQSWVAQTSGTTASMRGVYAVSAKVVWASGTEGSWLLTVNGGETWRTGHVEGAADLDFRGVRGVDERTAYLMSSGPGAQSRIYETSDGGRSWELLFTNPDAKGFFDGIAFWDSMHGMVVGDPVEGHFVVMTTQDGGGHWLRRSGPASLPEEGLFAASNTCLVVRGGREAWFATGGPGAARVFHSTDGGGLWTLAATPVRNDSASAGIFSLGFADGRAGVAVGGDYKASAAAARNAAVTSDSGASWVGVAEGPNGYRSAVVYLGDRRTWIATGTSGSDISVDGGRTWKAFDEGAFNAMSAVSSESAWAVGPKGRIAKLRMK